MAATDGEALTGPSHEGPGAPSEGARPLDHAWFDNGHGILSCVAGHEHAPDTIAACPYYLRSDVVEKLPARFRPGARTASAQPLRYRGSSYHKVTSLAPPQRWRELVAALPPHHRLRPCTWSTISAVDTSDVAGTLDPRDALAAALRAPNRGPSAELLGRLVAAADDPGNRSGSFGLTGSAALAPPNLRPNTDIDLLVYLDPASEDTLWSALAGLRAVSLGDLTPNDMRLHDYRASRTMPPVANPATRATMWRRRRDVAWIGTQRLDLTFATPHTKTVDTLAYDHQPVGPFHGQVTVNGVIDRHPVLLEVYGADVSSVIVTARGFQSSFRPGDRLAIRGLRHDSTDGPHASIDDCAGHHVTLLEDNR
jgi:hypothetical protein